MTTVEVPRGVGHVFSYTHTDVIARFQRGEIFFADIGGKEDRLGAQQEEGGEELFLVIGEGSRRSRLALVEVRQDLLAEGDFRFGEFVA